LQTGTVVTLGYLKQDTRNGVVAQTTPPEGNNEEGMFLNLQINHCADQSEHQSNQVQISHPFMTKFVTLNLSEIFEWFLPELPCLE